MFTSLRFVSLAQCPSGYKDKLIRLHLAMPQEYGFCISLLISLTYGGDGWQSNYNRPL